jgi:hypothetical protein
MAFGSLSRTDVSSTNVRSPVFLLLLVDFVLEGVADFSTEAP